MAKENCHGKIKNGYLGTDAGADGTGRRWILPEWEKNCAEGNYPNLLPASDSDFGREWLDYKMSVKTVGSTDEAIAFIQAKTSHHSECIVSSDSRAIARFQREIDAACVYANASTAFTDGAQFGFGAEIGISTQKLHARGPMALPELTTYKYVITGNGQTRK